MSVFVSSIKIRSTWFQCFNVSNNDHVHMAIISVTYMCVVFSPEKCKANSTWHTSKQLWKIQFTLDYLCNFTQPLLIDVCILFHQNKLKLAPSSHQQCLGGLFSEYWPSPSWAKGHSFQLALWPYLCSLMLMAALILSKSPGPKPWRHVQLPILQEWLEYKPGLKPTAATNSFKIPFKTR